MGGSVVDVNSTCTLSVCRLGGQHSRVYLLVTKWSKASLFAAFRALPRETKWRTDTVKNLVLSGVHGWLSRLSV